jgi:hypothetical protein
MIVPYMKKGHEELVPFIFIINYLVTINFLVSFTPFTSNEM